MGDLAALQAALATEYEVVYGYGVAGAHLSDDAETYALSRLTVHMQRRDALTALIASAGGTPVSARAAYRLPFRVTNATSAGLLAGHLEQGASDAYWDLVAAAPASSSARQQAIDWLTDSAMSAAQWGATQALPGQPA